MNELDGNDREADLLEAYVALSAPVSPPVDLLARVDHGIRRHRVRRLAAGAAALGIAGAIGFGLLAGGADTEGKPDYVADAGGNDTSTLTYTDEDGTAHSWDARDLGVACGRTYDGHRIITLARDEALDAATEGEPPSQVAGAVLHVELLLDKVSPGRVFALPFDVPRDEPPFDEDDQSERRPMTFFFTDGISDGSNELSSAEPESSGTVIVHDLSCDGTPTLDIEIDGTLGSEVEKPALAIVGRYRS